MLVSAFLSACLSHGQQPQELQTAGLFSSLKNVFKGKDPVSEVKAASPQSSWFPSLRFSSQSDDGSPQTAPDDLSSTQHLWFNNFLQTPTAAVDVGAEPPEPLLVPLVVPVALTKQIGEGAKKEPQPNRTGDRNTNEEVVLPDPRLVPHAIFEMNCRPGLVFHQCVRVCLSNKLELIQDVSDADTFTTCVEDCRDAYLNSPGAPGCMDERGRVAPKNRHTVMEHDRDAERLFNARTFRWKAWWWRLRQHQLTNFAIGHLDAIAAMLIITLMTAIYRFHGMLALYVLVCGPFDGCSTKADINDPKYFLVRTSKAVRPTLAGWLVVLEEKIMAINIK